MDVGNVLFGVLQDLEIAIEIWTSPDRLFLQGCAVQPSAAAVGKYLGCWYYKQARLPPSRAAWAGS